MRYIITLFWALMLTCSSLMAGSPLLERLQGIKEISDIREMEVEGFEEYYEFWFEQPVDHEDASRGTFRQRVLLGHRDFNAPVVVSNGAGIYDFQAGRYVKESQLPHQARAHMGQLCARYPDLSFEAYHGEEIYVYNPNVVTLNHLNRVGVPYQECGVDQMPTPWTKVIVEQDHPMLVQAQEYLLSHWGEDYEVIFSNLYLLEVTAKGANKGTMVAYVAKLLGIKPENVYCMGDNQNDIPMLEVSAIPFAPANCAQPVKAWGARLVGHTDDHAVAQVIEILDGIYK